MAQLVSLDLLQLACDYAYDIEYGANEFIVCLRVQDRETALASWRRLLESMTAAKADGVVAEPLRQAARVDEAHLAALEREVQAMRNSTSWRLTRPLRALARRLRRTPVSASGGDQPVK